MKSRTTARFRRAFAQLPVPIQNQARRAYRRFRDNPTHPGLRFKQVQADLSVYSVRISKGYRALGQVEGNEVVWFWIGSHDDYERLIAAL